MVVCSNDDPFSKAQVDAYWVTMQDFAHPGKQNWEPLAAAIRKSNFTPFRNPHLRPTPNELFFEQALRDAKQAALDLKTKKISI